ncbi:MAG: ribonuclease H-like domain-containing protein [Deltaproteobacteria bacterium]|nr:ribonuclease H-like domain-containing protein [Deltaproteobacteria bacterium]
MGDLLRKLRRRFGEGEGGAGAPQPNRGPQPAAAVRSEPRPAGRGPDAEEPAAAHGPGQAAEDTPAEQAREEPAAPDRQDVLEGLRRRIAALDKRWKDGGAQTPVAARRAAAFEILPGRMVETRQGPVRMIAETVARGSGHGRFAVGDFATEPSRLAPLAGLYRLRTPPRPEGLIFLDTETTGLAGGAGTLPFLVGLAWIEGGDLRVEQLFLDHPRHEPALVAHLRERLSAFDHVVTYNGRAFDIPLLQNRFVLHRTPWPPLDASLDLLTGARRLHRRHLADRSLASIERNVLGFFREDDVPGAEIPGIYHRFLFTGTTERLAGVIRHNAWDVVAMAALLGLHARLLSTSPADHELDPAVDLALGELRYATGELDAAAGSLARAVARCERSGAPPAPGAVWADALLWLARAHRRRGRHDEAAACWRRILAALPDHGAAHLALAKYHEHRSRRWEEAERHARAAAAAGAEDAGAAERRAARLAASRLTVTSNRPAVPRRS